MSNFQHAGPMVAGYDGSPGANRALQWAVGEAALRNVELQVVHSIEWPVYVGLSETGWLNDQEHRDLAVRLTAAARAGSGYTGDVSILDGSAAATLCRLSKTASLLVTGSRGMSDFAGLIVGSTAASVAVHAKCTVVVVREGGSAMANRRPIVVGVDESAHAHDAVHLAFAEASIHGCDVVALRAWRPGPDPLGEIDTAERHALRNVLEPASNAYPEVKFSLRLVADRAGSALVEASAGAQLVVIGARGTGGFKGMLLGSVGHSLLYHAHCPVALVR